jgi:hypothetical protein
MPKLPKLPKVNVFYLFYEKKTHAKLSFHCSDLWPAILPASTTYTKDGAKRPHNFRHFRHFSAF